MSAEPWELGDDAATEELGDVSAMTRKGWREGLGMDGGVPRAKTLE
jgi:hypothetical protein